MNDAIQKAISKFGSQEALAKAIGVRQAVISHYLVGRRNPSPRVAGLLSTAVNNEIEWHEFIPSPSHVQLAEPKQKKRKLEIKVNNEPQSIAL